MLWQGYFAEKWCCSEASLSEDNAVVEDILPGDILPEEGAVARLF